MVKPQSITPFQEVQCSPGTAFNPPCRCRNNYKAKPLKGDLGVYDRSQEIRKASLLRGIPVFPGKLIAQNGFKPCYFCCRKGGGGPGEREPAETTTDPKEIPAALPTSRQSVFGRVLLIQQS